MSADEAATHVPHGAKVGMSGFTGAAYPKALPAAIARRAQEAHGRGDEYAIDLYTGASTAPDCDGVLAEAGALRYRMPYQSDPVMRKSINAGGMKYQDIHLSHSGRQVAGGVFGQLDIAIVECTRITEEGHLVPSSGVGNNVEFLDAASKIIVEVNSWQSLDLEGMADIYRVKRGVPIPITASGDRIGTPYIDIDVNKVVAVVETDAPDRNAPFKPIEVPQHRVVRGGDPGRHGRPDRRRQDDRRLGHVLLPLARVRPEDERGGGPLPQVDHHPSAAGVEPPRGDPPPRPHRHQRHDRGRPLRQHQLHPCRRLSDHEFTRNGLVSSFISPSVAKDGAISAVVPFASHIDHTEHDAMVVITEYGYADLRGLAPSERAERMIAIAHPDYRPLLEEYVARAASKGAAHTPHDLSVAFDFHNRLATTGTMKP